MKNTDDILIAHVELAKARFSHGEELGIEFKSEIDAWTKMEVHFRHQLQNPRYPKRTFAKQDLKPFIYSFRHKVE